MVNGSLFSIPVDQFIAESHHNGRVVCVRVIYGGEVSLRCLHVHGIFYTEHMQLVVGLAQGLVVLLFGNR